MFYNYPERTRQIYYPEKVFYMPDVKNQANITKNPGFEKE